MQDRQSGPRPEAALIQSLNDRVRTGDIRVPAFQRGFVWRQPQVLDLMDSIRRNYPVGTILLWFTEERLEIEKELAGFPLPDHRVGYPVNYILDGQQRLGSIYGVLHYPGPPGESHPFNVSVDLEKMIFSQTPASPGPTNLRMYDVGDTSRFLARLAQAEADDPSGELRRRAEGVFNAFLRYALPTVTLADPTLREVGTIFERINSKGTRLTVFDLMVAATWGGGFDLRGTVRAARKELARHGFGKISDVAVLQLLAANRTGGAGRDAIDQLRDHNEAELREAAKRTHEGLRRAADFLKSEFRVGSADFLPYERQLQALAYARGRQGRMSAQATRMVRRWFWRTSFTERYRRGGEGLFDEDLATLLTIAQGEGDLDRFGKDVPPASIFRSTFRKGTALTGAFAALLAHAEPLNLRSGTRIDTSQVLSSYNRKEFHHIFPQRYLAPTIPASQSNLLANICMLAADDNKWVGKRAPSDYIRELQANHGDEFGALMQSNLIPAEALPALLNDDYPTFIELRAAYLGDRLASLW